MRSAGPLDSAGRFLARVVRARRPVARRYNSVSRLHKTVHDYYRQAYRKLARLPEAGAPRFAAVFGADNNCAAFQLEVAGGFIARADYRCTTCVTLIALCEHLAELAIGMSVEEASGYRPVLLLDRHPEIPPGRRDRAELAVQALKVALHHIEGGPKS